MAPHFGRIWPRTKYIQGQKNIVADALSRLELKETMTTHEHLMLMAYSMTKVEPRETEIKFKNLTQQESFYQYLIATQEAEFKMKLNSQKRRYL